MIAVARPRGLACDRLPPFEAAPVIFFGGANLVGQAEMVCPTFLFGTPTAIPDKGVGERLTGRLDVHRADEIGAAGAAVKHDALDPKVGLGCQHVGQQSPNFDSRSRSFHLNVFGCPVRIVGANGGFESFLGVRVCEDGLQFGQGRPSSKTR